MNAEYLKHIASNGIRTLGVITAATALTVMSVPAYATLVVPTRAQAFTQPGTVSGSGLQATDSFWVSDSSQLRVNRANTSSKRVIAPRQVLQAAYRDMTSSVSLSLITPTGRRGIGSAGLGNLANRDKGVSQILSSRNRTDTLRVTQKITKVSAVGRTPRPASTTARASARTTTKKHTALRLRGGGDLGILGAGDNLSTYNGGFINSSTTGNSSVTIASSMPLNDTSYKPSQVGDLNIKNIAYNDVTSATPLTLVPPTALPEPTGLALFLLSIGLMLRSLRKRRSC